MLTKNAKKLILYCIMDSCISGTTHPEPNVVKYTLTNIQGNSVTTDAYASSMYSFINSLNHVKTDPTQDSITFIRCGTGTSEPTENDYGLSFVSGMSCDSVITSIGGNVSKKIYTATFSNNTDADIVVTEIGFLTNFFYTRVNNDNFLLDRILLETPITIPAGESKAITYELGF